MKFLFATGGTAGHINPALAVASYIRENYPESEILFIGTSDHMESKLVPSAGFELDTIEINGFRRSFSPSAIIFNIKTVFRLLRSEGSSKKIIKRFNPDVVIGFGGYVSGPVLQSAARLKIPTCIHEQNAYPGVTNKLLEKGVKNVFLGFARAAEYFKEQDKLVVSGNPVRDEFRNKDRTEARRALGYDDDRFVVLAFGGSQGAGRINKAMVNVIKDLNGRSDISIVLGAGSYYYDAIIKSFEEEGFEFGDNIRVIEYIDDMASYLAAADLVISRSGALTVAETTVSGRPAIFIPSPMVTGNHQYYNALAVAEAGGAIIIEEKNLEDAKLTEEIIRLKDDPQALARMAKASRECGPDRATDIICDKILEEIESD